MTAPLGGWRTSEGVAAPFLQKVHYPAASVNIEGASAGSLIQGRIHQQRKATAPATLIVNGVALPLATDESGNFARPYAFGAGTNSIEVRTAQRSVRQRVQFYDAYAAKAAARLRIVLSWDSDGTDLDLHVLSPGGHHVFYGNRVGADGGALDVDVTTGYGPEIFAHPSPARGAWHVYVNYYGRGAGQDVTVAQVAIVSQEGTLAERRQVLRVPMRKPGELTLVKSFIYP